MIRLVAVVAMVRILDGNLDIGAHMWNEIGDLFCLRPRSTSVVKLLSIF